MNEIEQLRRVLREVAELRAGLERLQERSSGFSQLNALSDYLHQLDSIEPPENAFTVRAREAIEALTRLNLELRRSLNTRPGSAGLTH